VTETGYIGFDYQRRIDRLEDAAVDRCFAETRGDRTCRLYACTPGY
jgi:hypothetical protein